MDNGQIKSEKGIGLDLFNQIANENQKCSEKDPLTLKRYEIFYRYFKTNHINELDFETGRRGVLLKK